jgi:hypothetical protein
MTNKSGIHIDPSKRGSFTRAAKPGESTQQHAARVLNNPNASKAMRRKAAFAKAQRKFHRGGRRSKRA